MITGFINKRTKEKNAELPQAMTGWFRPSSPLFVLQPLSIIGTLEYLTGAKGMACRTIVFDIGQGTGFNAPSVIYENFHVDAEIPVEGFLIGEGTRGNISHGK